MARKKRKNVKNETNIDNKRIKTKKSRVDSKESKGLIEKNERNELLSNDLRRSKRISTVNSVSNETKSKKSKYFSSESEENPIDSEDSDGSDQEFKPEIKPKLNIIKQKLIKSDSDSNSSEDEEWEEVKDDNLSDFDDYKPDIPKEGVEITINDPLVKAVKKRKSVDINDIIRQKLNRFKRELQLNKHKTSLLLFISRALYLNESLNDEILRAIAFSISINQFKAPKKLTIKYLNDFIDWFNKNFELKNAKKEANESIIDSISRCLQEKIAKNSIELNLTFISLLRSVNQKYDVRLCYVLNPVDLKANDLILSGKQLETKKKPSNAKKSSNKAKETKNETKTANKSKTKNRRKIVSSDSEVSISVESETNYLKYWVEVYVESERKWVSIDLLHKIIDKPHELADKIEPNFSYIIAVDNEGYIREVTQRYTNEWMSVVMKKRRVDQNWWSQTLAPFQRSVKNGAEKAEDTEFEDKLSSKPLPTKVSEYKNHPLYVLKKDLLKFQAIYPSDAPPLGFFKGEPVYARECVQTCRSRETWVRFARTVKIGESPYKMVTSRPKWDKYAKTWRRDLPLELFGEWQTQAYDPPEAKDGKVPRNEFGNVDLFQPCMLPKGCVHLQLSGLIRIANKLKIDCVPAVVAFDNNNGGLGFHPVMDGFIVCKEFEETLIDAWNEEQENARKRELEKREKRIYGNWKKLIKGLLIREKVKNKYKKNNYESDTEDNTEDSDD